MQKLNIDLEHCYGIKKFKEELDFSNFNVVAIYASNGMMKTSFANTFRDLSNEKDSKDRIFPDRKTIRIIKDEKNKNIIQKNIFVIEPYDENYDSKKKSTLLVNKKLQKEYSDIYEKIDEIKDKFLKELGSLAGSTRNIEKKISESFSNKAFFDILEQVETIILETTSPKFLNIKHNEIFNEKALAFLDVPDSKRLIKEYVEKYNSLLSESEYLQQGFNHYNISSIQQNLKSNGFFNANHSINLNGRSIKQEITTVKDLETVIQKQKDRILKAPEVLEKWNVIDKKLSANKELRSFRDYLFDNIEILPELENLETFSKEIWLSYFIDHKDLFKELLHEYMEGKEAIKKIVEIAKKQETDWKNVIKLYNSRFLVPFTISVENQSDVILKNTAPSIKFDFKDSTDNIQVDKPSLLQVLSMGEKKALYVLNILFEIEVRKKENQDTLFVIDDLEARKKENQDTLFVIDDLADSFDYKNKYAIIQYLKEISKESFFKLIILTHNFDFFRTIESRKIVNYSNCFLTYSEDQKFVNTFVGFLKI